MEEQCLIRYIDVSEEELLSATRRENILNEWNGEDNKQLKHWLMQECKEKWMTKPLHGQSLDKHTKSQTQRAGLKKETEGFVMAAQDQALQTNAIKVKIDKQEGEATCRMCKNREETVTHVISECTKLAQLECKKRDDKVTGAVYWSLCETYHIKHSEQWYQHTAEPVVEMQSVIVWDMDIQMDRVIEHRWPDIIVIDKDNKRALLIDIAVPADAGVEEKVQEKMDRYQDLARKLKRFLHSTPLTGRAIKPQRQGHIGGPIAQPWGGIGGYVCMYAW